MRDQNTHASFSWQAFAGPNLGYVNELYEAFLADPNAVDPSTRQVFETYGAPPATLESSGGAAAASVSEANISKVVGAMQLIENVRTYGHLQAHIDPLQDSVAPVDVLQPRQYGLTEADLQQLPASVVWKYAPTGITNALAAYQQLMRVYTGSLAFEFSQVTDLKERAWLDEQVETGKAWRPRTSEQKRNTLERLMQVELFERFLHRQFVGQKRFSIEGVDMLVPMLDRLIEESARAGAEAVMIGMAHRGRLNVLAHNLGKPYAKIFSEFHSSPNKELVPSEGSMGINYGWTGDVKYHLGASRTMDDLPASVKLVLANNPSHLEFVDPVIEGFARAAQEERSAAGYPKLDVKKAVAVQIHGDAAFIGEGIVAETLNMSRLRGYQTGGTIHIIANNRLGFTVESDEGRSTRYASDLAKGFEIPVVHVSADDPDACIAAIELATLYRQTFGKDFMIDLIGYRRWGHNEMDEPQMTQPVLYAKIKDHPTVMTRYQQQLLAEGVLTEQEAASMQAHIEDTLKSAYQEVAELGLKPTAPEVESTDDAAVNDTSVPAEELKQINSALLQYPEGFQVFPKLNRILSRRATALDGGKDIDCALAEALAFGSILADGTPIRLTGQDSERGTFGHRHLVLHDANNGEEFVPLHALPQAKASFAIHNSPLSEGAVIGFEYGYNVHSQETLVLWEAQFGDFANAGQVLFDQFISSGLAKWCQLSGLVMLLPHGYEGQGPEHSSARLERYLQMSADNNWIVANVTTAAQYFHLLRRQAKSLKGSPRPLVLMSPKSLLRNPRAASSIDELASGRFEPVLVRSAKPKQVERIVFCSGKVAVDFAAAQESSSDDLDWLGVIRIEQLYPFPTEAIRAVLAAHPKATDFVWMQEEPKNMGAWTYIEPRLRELLGDGATLSYAGRPERSSPAEGMADVHQQEQSRIFETVMTKKTTRVMTTAGK